MEKIEFSRWLFEGRLRQGKNVLPDGLNWLCYFAGSQKAIMRIQFISYFWNYLIKYSHLSNKRDVTLTDFEKFHPPQNKNPPYTFIDFLDFSTLHSTFIRFMY